ncbi:MAG: hypothetical protein KJN61_02845 [Gammaproteobacteria bacterium]|nr:hypothetical protein [Gammaproteobacteria bacterium]MBT8075382.1 hypothetical protein [Gammaproteobacteria bacterium]
MTLRLPLAIISIAAIYFSANANAATIIDFSAYPENTAITDQFADQGVTFRGLEEGVQVANVTANFSSTTGDTFLSNCYPTRCDQRADVVEVSFTFPASNVSFGLDSEGSSEITFNAYDTANNLLETFSAASDGGIVAFTAVGISRIDMLQPNDNWGWGFANLTFDGSAPLEPVPTMSAYGLMALILSIMLIMGSRMRASVKRD